MTQTVEAALLAAARTLREGGIETASLDGRLLLCHASGLTHEALIARNREALPPEAVALLEGEPALDEIVDALITDHQTNQLAAMQEPEA